MRTRFVFSMRVFVFWSQAYWKLFFNDEDGAVPFFKWIFWLFFRTRIVFQWESLFVWFQHYWKTIFNESVFFCRKANWKWIFQWQCLFFGLRPIENWFFNESVCLFGLRHCGRRCCALFSFQFVNFWRPELFF